MGEASDSRAEDALVVLARRDEDEAEAARSAFHSLTFGEGLQSVTLYGLQYWLWYQLPTKWWTDLTEHLQIAAALGALFEQLNLSRYAVVCASDTTTRVIAAWHQSREAGFAALNKAMSASGVEPPDVEGVLAWGKVMGLQENDALQLAAAQLEAAIVAGDLVPGARGWRAAAEQVTREFLTLPRAVPGGSSWLEAIHTERMETWAASRGTARKRLTSLVAPLLVAAPPVPEDAEELLAPVRWLLDLAAAEGGIPLTANHTLARAVVAEGCQRFDWLTLTGKPRSESDIVEAWTLRELLRQLGVVRRSKRSLLLTPAGKRLAAADTATLWATVVPTLIPADQADAVAAEITLMLHLTGAYLGYGELCAAVAEAMTGEGWRAPSTGDPITGDGVGWFIGALHRRLDLLGLLRRQRTPDDYGERLTDAGKAAALAALRARTAIGFG